ncbi:MAG TPA: efflux RND transporter permease subunit, partial [Gemmatimonadaceae bacterium]|nr:efflux RND transporter permease subunit [Gemmatimonadaceae bacterium]
PERLASVLVPVNHDIGAPRDGGTTAAAMSGAGATQPGSGGMGGGGRVAQVPLGQLATVRQVAGPMVVRSEGAVPTAWVYIDVAGRDIGSYVRDAQRMVGDMVQLPAGYSIVWSGQYEYMQRAQEKMQLVIPATLAIIFLLLYFNFKSVGETLIVMLSLPFALVGGIWLLWALGYDWSVPVAIGFIALSGVAAETGVIMLIYLDHAWDAQRARTGHATMRDLYDAVVEGAVERVRPKMMTVTAIMAGLLPIFWGNGTGVRRLRPGANRGARIACSHATRSRKPTRIEPCGQRSGVDSGSQSTTSITCVSAALSPRRRPSSAASTTTGSMSHPTRGTTFRSMRTRARSADWPRVHGALDGRCTTISRMRRLPMLAPPGLPSFANP